MRKLCFLIYSREEGKKKLTSSTAGGYVEEQWLAGSENVLGTTVEVLGCEVEVFGLMCYETLSTLLG